MRGTMLLGMCALLLAPVAAAQDEAAGPRPLDARWSLGAGLGLGGVYLVSPGVPGLGLGSGLGSLGLLSGRASLEYLLAEDLALVLGGAGAYARSTLEMSSDPTEPDPTVGYGLSANVGLRKYVAGQGATRFSMHALLSLGFARRDVPNVNDQLREEHARSASLGAGIAVDHQLLERLSVRVGADIVSASLLRLREVTTVTEGVPPQEATSQTTAANFYFAPSVELRLAF